MTLTPEDVAKALAHEFTPKDHRYDEKDVCLYALAVGAGADPVDAKELKYVYELHPHFTALPTMAVVFPFVVFWQMLEVPGLTFNPMMLLHGEQYLELNRPLPTSASLTTRGRISKIYDKGKGALVLLDVTSTNEHGEVVAFNRSSVYIRGLGGWGGERGPSSKGVNAPPERAPDASMTQATQPNQALLYRLASGDGNPLHADPQMAALGGFDRPILHGLCTYSFAGRAILHHFAGNDPSRFKSIQARFSKHVFPGETLITEMWQENETRILFQTRVDERDELVLSNGAVELHPD